MNSSWTYFLFTAAAVLVFVTRQSNGSELSLCLADIENSVCQVAKPISPRSISLNININKDDTEAKLVLKGAYSKFNISVAVAANKANIIFAVAGKMVSTQPKAAAQKIDDAMEDARESLYDAVASLFGDLAEASSLTNDKARQGLTEAIQKVQIIQLEVFDSIRTVISLSDQLIINGGDPAKETVESLRLSIKALFDSLMAASQSSYQQSLRAVSGDGQIQQTENQNANASANDSDAISAILNVSKAAQDAINKGADRIVVQRLYQSITNCIENVAAVAEHVRQYFLEITEMDDPTTAKNFYLEQASGVCNKVQAINGDLSMILAAAGVGANSSTKQQIENAIKAIQRGNDEVVIGNKNAKHMTLFALIFSGEVRNSALKAAAQIGRSGKICWANRMVEGASIAFKALSKK